MIERMPLTDMEAGETGTVAEILGGREVLNRLRGLGIRPGVKVTKVTKASAHGPVVVRVGGSQVSFGFGVSYKIIMSVDR